MPRNVILITVDCLRWDRLSASGYDRPVSPTMDRLARDGAFCDEAIATGPATRTSFPGILCSTYPLMYGGYAQLTGERDIISEVFQERGYRTVGVNTNTQLHARFGWDRGWDVYYDSERTHVHDPEIDLRDDDQEPSRAGAFVEAAKEKVYSTLDQDGLPYRLIESAYRRVGSRSPPHDSAAAAVDRTFDILDAAPGEQPLFLWVHFMEPHSPYVPPKSYRQQFLDAPLSDGEMWRLNDKVNSHETEATSRDVAIISDLYDASIREVDDQIDRLLDGLETRGYMSDAVTLLCGDHGEEFHEHGALAHGGRPYDELIRVPLIVDATDERLEFPDGVTSTIDIGPTLLDMALSDAAHPETFHGLSLVSALRGETDLPADRAVFSQIASGGWREIDLDNRITACRTDEWKLISSVREDDPDELFRVSEDQYEQEDRREEYPDVYDRLQERIEAHYELDAYDDYAIEDAVEPDHLGEQLEALGYVD